MKQAVLILLLSWPAISVSAQQVPDSHARLSDVLTVGERASRGSGSRDAEQLATAARTLARMGAHPMDDGQDLAQVWARQAVRMGAKKRELPEFRGRVLGPAYRRIQLNAAQPDVSTATFLAGQTAAVTLTPIGSVRLELDVKNADDSPACTVSFQAGNQHCTWLPLYTTRYQITVVARQSGTAQAFVILN